MINFEFVAKQKESKHVHTDIELFYVLEGTVRFTLEDKQYSLLAEDFLIVNVDKNHFYSSESEFLGVCMHISHSELSALMKQSVVFFWCNTAEDNNESCMELRETIKRIITEQYRNGDKNRIYLNSLYYSMLHILTSDFLLSKEDRHFKEETKKFDARKQEIADYVRLNFDKQISLEDLANRLFLSYAYLSKYIKRNFGMGFAEYLNSVRLSFAVSQLIHSEQSVVRIAMESGFASSAALNKAFREKYGITPTEYRKKMISKSSEAQAVSGEEKQLLQDQLNQHFKSVNQEETSSKKLSVQEVFLGNSPKKTLKKNWNKMINMGTALDLLQSDTQNHVLYLKKELQVEYIRFWDLYDPELLLRGNDDSLNFDKIDRIFDFLLNNGMKPYVELQVKPKKVMGNLSNTFIYRPSEGTLEIDVRSERFLRRFITHLLNRYNTEELESWYFELWDREPDEVLKDVNRAQELMPIDDYLDLFDMVANIIRDYVPNAHVGGGGFSLRYGKEYFHSILEKWTHHEQLPDFISVYGYPYTSYTTGKDRNQSRNTYLLREMVVYARDTMNELNFPTDKLHITEWNFSVSNRNSLNDSCMKGAYLVRNMIDCIDIADVMGYWVGSDLYASYYDSKTPVSGSGGLLSKDGIRKPAFYAFDFMNHLGKYIRKKGENYIITDNGSGNWRIVCHNLKTLGYQYSLLEEGDIKPAEQSGLFTDMKKSTIHFDIPGKKGGRYLLHIHSVNQYHGSLQDEWLAMSSPEELTREDLRYLGRITTPRMVLGNVTADNGRIVFDVTMEPNEITYIHVTYQYT